MDGMSILCDAINAQPDFQFALPNTSGAGTANLHATNDSTEYGGQTEHHRVLEQPGTDRAHQCRICNRSYERIDHLNRHLRSHENARRFKCSRCPKRFNRQDLLNRHAASHEKHDTTGISRPPIRRTDRAAAACAACAAAKVKCENEKPCRRCRSKNLACQPSSDQMDGTSNIYSARRNNVSHVSLGSTASPSESGSHTLMDQPESANVDEGLQSTNFGDEGPVQVFKTDHQIYNESFQLNDSNQDTTAAMQYSTMNPEPLSQEDMMNDVMFSPNVSGFNQDLDFGFWDFPLDAFQIPYANGEVQGQSAIEPGQTPGIPKPNRDTARGYAAFKRSPWLWSPASKDRALSDQSDLTIHEDQLATSLTPSSIAGGKSFDHIFLDSSARDRIFALVLSTNSGGKAVPGFPQIELFNQLLQNYFVRQSYLTTSWIHIPSFDSAKCQPHLLIALISAGSTLVSVPAIWKLGLALQEVTRLTIADLYESKNSYTRDIEVAQAFALMLEVGLWSGFKRKMEIAESFALPLVTMLRRAGAFAAPQETARLTPDPTDDGQYLESKWRRWVKRESYKRLAIHLYLYCTQSSISFQTSPLILLSEFKFPLPASRGLWLANSAMEWKNKYLERNPLESAMNPKLIDLLYDTSLLDILQDYIDQDLCCTAIMYSFWGQVWSFQESSKFYMTGGSQGTNSQGLWLTMQQSELSRDVENLITQLSKIQRQPFEIQLIQHLFLMALHVSFDELQKFAGKGGEEEASRAHAFLQSWVDTPNARKAAWYSGQLLRAARQFPPAELRGFFSIAVYLGSLTLWVYAHLSTHLSAPENSSRAPETSQTSRRDRRNSDVALDGPETRETRVFVSAGQGRPGLTSSSGLLETEEEFASLDDPNVAFKVARQIYRHNFPILEEPLPPLVENLETLMKDLSGRPESRFSRAVSEELRG